MFDPETDSQLAPISGPRSTLKPKLFFCQAVVSFLLIFSYKSQYNLQGTGVKIELPAVFPAMTECQVLALSTPVDQSFQMFVKNGLQPAPNVPNPRNAGRKKSNPVWEFFTDLRSYGLAGVRCRFCHWVTNDRSPTTMKFHLKRKHDTGVGGLWAICEEKINAQAPANYAPRIKKTDDALLKALTQPRPLNPFNPFGPVAEAKITMVAQDELLASLIQQAQNMANSSAEIDSTMVNDHVDGGLSLSDTLFLNKLNENGLMHPKEEDGSSSSASGLVSNTCDFNLNEGITALLQIASDADLAFSFNSRSRAEYCFSSNQRAGRSVAFSDMGAEIRVAQKVGDEEIAVETWRKSDWNQFCWAVRGTCLHFLKN